MCERQKEVARVHLGEVGTHWYFYFYNRRVVGWYWSEWYKSVQYIDSKVCRVGMYRDSIRRKNGAVAVGSMMMVLRGLFVILLVACPVTVLGRKGKSPSWIDNSSEDREQISVELSGRRKMQQACPVCPSNAGQICASMDASEKSSASQRLVSVCGAGNFQPDACCGLRGSSQWDSIVACACAGEDTQAARYVNLDTVGTICGCGGASRTIPSPIRFDQEMLPLIG